jgi:heat shock protein HslJ
MGLIENLREDFFAGAADLLGFADRLAERDTFDDMLQEAGSDARMLQRRVEELNWEQLSGDPQLYFSPNRIDRKGQVQRAYTYYFNDPVIRRTVDLITFYTFGKGMNKPVYRRKGDDAEPEEQEAQNLIDNFWGDDFNQETLTSAEAQYEKSTELQLQANVFLLCFMNPGESRERGAPSPLRLSDISETEIAEIITHPGNKKVPVYYKREFRPKKWDFASGTWSSDSTPTTRYYRDWRHEAPTEWEGEEWGPAPERIGKGFVYHISVNKTSDMRFGITTLNSVLKWSAGLNEYLSSRVSTIMAIAQLALQVKTKGAPKNVAQVTSSLQDITRIATRLDQTTHRRHVPYETGKTKGVVSSPNASLEPMIQDTGASNAQTDINTIMGQVSAGTGMPAHHLGGPGTANQASTNSMDMSLLRGTEANQALWLRVVMDLVGWMMTECGLEKDRLEMSMPPILNRDAGALAQQLAGVLNTVDPGISSRELVRWYMGEVLDAMGSKNTQELLDKFFPESWESPWERQQKSQLAQMHMQGQMGAFQQAAAAFGKGGEGGGGTPGPPPMPDAQEAFAAAGESLEEGSAAFNVPRPGKDLPGGPGTGGDESRSRARRRGELAVGGRRLQEGDVAVPDELVDLIESVFDEMDADDGTVAVF